ncbi:GumC family protein [Pedobacter alpinus]|uniref:non-specific protein-tyrosine kinase n=1 Tax=Pedobacter alpinus TaxID=1590643 RepID=A0ABW5TTS9_9SPHI
MFNTTPKNDYPIVRAYSQDDSFKPREVLMKYLFHWPLFFISLTMCIALAAVYLKITQPVYEIKASLLIKDDNNLENNRRSGNALQELDLTSPNKAVDTEMEVLKSRSLITTLVSDLQLWIDYQSDKKIGKENLFGKSPVKINFSRTDEKIESKKILVYIKNDKTFFITEKADIAVEYQFDKEITSSIGTFVIEKTPFYKDYVGKAIVISFKDFERTVSDYQKGIEIALLNKKSPTVGLTLTDATRERGKSVLNYLITIYNKATFAEKNRVTASTLNFIDSRLATISKELSEVEKESEQFKSSRRLTDITSESRIFLENAQANDTKLNDVKVKLNVIEGIEEYISSNSLYKKVPSTLGIDDPGLNGMIAKLNELETNKARLLSTTPENNPIFNPINSQIADLKTAIKINISTIKLTLENTKAKLEIFEEGFKADISKIPGEEREYIAIKRQQNVKQDLFLYLLKKKEEISLSYASTLADARVIDAAYAGPVKWPNKILVLVIALLAGLGLPLGLLIARSLFNDKVKDSAIVNRETVLPVIAEIRQISTDKPIIINNPYFNGIIEEFRYLRTKILDLHSKTEQGRITLLTSNVTGEGKSFIASNLALSLAKSGRRVALLDLDLRRNYLASFFSIASDEPGVIQFLEGEIALESLVKKSEMHYGLDVIPSGFSSENLASELIEKVELEILMNRLKQNYDDIVIYAPPIRLAADALILAKFNPLLLFVVRCNRTKIGYLKFINSLQKSFTQTGIVINSAKPEEGINNYGNSYYQNKGYNKPNIGFKRKFFAFFKRF